jgi:hypothetical protein
LDAIKEPTMAEGPIATIIREKITAALAPTRLEIEDDTTVRLRRSSADDQHPAGRGTGGSRPRLVDPRHDASRGRRLTKTSFTPS